MRLRISFDFHPNELDILYTDNLFSHATLKRDFTVLDLYASYFDSDSESIMALDLSM